MDIKNSNEVDEKIRQRARDILQTSTILQMIAARHSAIVGPDIGITCNGEGKIIEASAMEVEQNGNK